MKRVSFLLLASSFLLCLRAQEFKPLYNLELPFKPTINWYDHTSDFKFFLCSTKEEMLVLDGTTGKILWHTTFAKEFGEKSISNQYWNKDANVIMLYNDDSKKGTTTKYFVDGKTGKTLWKSATYVSKLGDYKAEDGFVRDYDPATKGVILPTKETIDFVDIFTGKPLWSKSFALEGKQKNFDCFVMMYYDLVCVNTGKESSMFFTTKEGKEVTDIEPYLDLKKLRSDSKHAKKLDIPEKNMYVILQGETSVTPYVLGLDIPKKKMILYAFEEKTNKLVWKKNYEFAYAMPYTSTEPLIRLYYSHDKLFIQHYSGVSSKDEGLTVIDISNGEKMWTASFTCFSVDTRGISKNYMTLYPSPDPLVTNDVVYVADKKQNKLVCYDAKTGAIKWESEKFPDTQKIPFLALKDQILIMQYGAADVKDVAIAKSDGPSVYTLEYDAKDKYGIIAYDAKTGKIIWTGDDLAKKAGDKFKLIAGTTLTDKGLMCLTNKNLISIDFATGNLIAKTSIEDLDLGDVWLAFEFDKQQQIIVNCEKGIVKINAKTMQVESTLKTPNIPGYPAFNDMNYDDAYDDFAIFSKGDAEKMEYKKFACIDLATMSIRGEEDAEILYFDIDAFSEGAELFYRVDNETITMYSVKNKAALN
jgi:outer membrane protein assembly factor BamB